jgi:hypothetical protein
MEREFLRVIALYFLAYRIYFRYLWPDLTLGSTILLHKCLELNFFLFNFLSFLCNIKWLILFDTLFLIFHSRIINFLLNYLIFIDSDYESLVNLRHRVIGDLIVAVFLSIAWIDHSEELVFIMRSVNLICTNHTGLVDQTIIVVIWISETMEFRSYVNLGHGLRFMDGFIGI